MGRSRKEIHTIFRKLPLFDDLYLYMQAQNISIVDSYLYELESEMIREYIEADKTPIPQVMFVSALSQMWIFALYELLRTWKQWANELIEFAEDLEKIAQTKEKEKRRETIIKKQQTKNEKAFEIAKIENIFYKDSFNKIMQKPLFALELKEAINIVMPLFKRIESLRITLAKHEVSKTKRQRAIGPGYARIDTISGSLCWHVILKDGSSDIISRRSLADACKDLL